MTVKQLRDALTNLPDDMRIVDHEFSDQYFCLEQVGADTFVAVVSPIPVNRFKREETQAHLRLVSSDIHQALNEGRCSS